MTLRQVVSLDHGIRSPRNTIARRLDAAFAELDALADALPFLVARDDERPPLWLSPAFSAEVAEVRSDLSPVASRLLLAARLGHVPAEPALESGRFESAARRLSREAASVAFAIRDLEIRSGTRLPSWPELLRRRSVSVRSPELARGLDAALWFG